NSARELALQLERLAAPLDESRQPLLLLTNATADSVAAPEPPGAAPARDVGSPLREPSKMDLTRIYPGKAFPHTFRFCFTNRQMATSVTRFIWSQPTLRPDRDPAYLVRWIDDWYSKDLCDGYIKVLDRRAADNVAQQWGWVCGGVGLGVPPAVLAGW